MTVRPAKHYRYPNLDVIRIEWADGTERLIAQFRPNHPEKFYITEGFTADFERAARELAIEYNKL